MQYKVLMHGKGKEWQHDIVEVNGEPCAVPSERWKKQLLKPQAMDGVHVDHPLWRYMDLPKFVGILKDRAIWFARADMLGDPLEGSYTSKATLSPSELRMPFDHAKVEASMSVARMHHRNLLYVSCWHAHEYENKSLWGLYGRNSEAVAVRTTVSELMRMKRKPFELEGKEFVPQMLLGRTTYIDFDKEEIPDDQSALLFKSLAYRADDEMRAIIFLWNFGFRHTGETPAGFNIFIDPSRFMKDIVVSPDCSKLFLSVVQDLCKQYRIRVPVRRSSLERQPIF